MKKVKVQMQAEGFETEIKELLSVLRQFENLGEQGASRTIPVTVDGDGSGQLKFSVLEQECTGKKTPLKQKIQLKSEQINQALDGYIDYPEQSIGE